MGSIGSWMSPSGKMTAAFGIGRQLATWRSCARSPSTSSVTAEQPRSACARVASRLPGMMRTCCLYWLDDFMRRPCADPVSAVEQQTVEDAVLRMADARFDEDPHYVLAGLMEVVWQIKRKWTKQRVKEPLVTLFTSETQLTGKSELARRFVSPIREMTRDSITIEYILDRRNRELLEACALLINYADRTPRNKRGRFKSFVTAEEHN